jgi:hypothetical protein
MIVNCMATKLPRRSAKYGVGKEIGGAVYLHREYEERLGNLLAAAKAHLPRSCDYDVVKYNARTGAISFVQCTDFDSAPEPTVGPIVTVNADGSLRRRPQQRDPEVYHHRWLFVADDYRGFDVAESRRRSLAWLRLDGIDKKRIGKKSYWENHVVPRLNEPESDEIDVG